MSATLSPKSILLSNIWLKNYAGSELNCLTLAKQFKKMGLVVEVATLEYSNPIKADFEKEGISVKILPNDSLSRQHYDYLWLHHSIIANHILFDQKITADKIICSSLSPFEPYEVLPAYANHITVCLANSEETKAALIEEGFSPEKIHVFPNYVDDIWLEYPSKTAFPKVPKHVAIVSNHVPEELLSVATALNDQQIQVDIYGIAHTFALVTPELLSNYDLVITIGKTVQYAIALNIPVYCYDIHGGPGYLTEDCYEKAAFYNFSGRGFSKKTSERIIDDILSRYQLGCQTTKHLSEYLQQHFLLEPNLTAIWDKINSSPKLNCDELLSNYRYLKRYNESLTRLFHSNLSYIENQNRLVQDRDALILDRDALIKERDALIKERNDFSSQIVTIRNPRLWRLLCFVRRLFK